MNADDIIKIIECVFEWVVFLAVLYYIFIYSEK